MQHLAGIHARIQKLHDGTIGYDEYLEAHREATNTFHAPKIREQA